MGLKPKRIRDPVHDLISFEDTGFEKTIWRLLETPEFQRLRRIKQLGFSEFVFPGATHSRFSHSLGVFHMARKLVELVKVAGFQDLQTAKVAVAGALVHDLGHGPFSHAFEKAMKAVGKDRGDDWKGKNRHELWTAEIVRGNTEVNHVLEQFEAGFAEKVAALLTEETPSNIHSAIVSSQFDGDRLDYIQRDKLMTGVEHAGFDLSWLLANLEIGTIPVAVDEEEYTTVPTLVVGPKALESAESYVLGLFHLYFTVYFHKATRSAECMLSAILTRLGQLQLEAKIDQCGLSEENPVVRYLMMPDLITYLELDDSVMMGTLRRLTTGVDRILRELSHRLLVRDLYKCIDISAHFAFSESEIASFRAKLSQAKSEGKFEPYELLEDFAERNPYKRKRYGTPSALETVYFRRGNKPEDLAKVSDVVGALNTKSVYRIFVRNDAVRTKVQTILEGAS